MQKYLFLFLAALVLAACQSENGEKGSQSAKSGKKQSREEKPYLAPEKPNVIFIMADDLGYADIGAYGQQSIHTPNLDQMAQEGTRFTQFYAGSPVCAPARSTLMTGLHTGHTPIRGNTSQEVEAKYPLNRVPLEDEDLTMAEVFKSAGYVTGMTGKWGLGEPGSSGLPNKQGFDQWFGYLNQNYAHDYYADYLWKNQEKYEIPENEGKKEGVYTHNLFTDFALDFIDQNQDTSFFLYVPYCLPHSDFEVPEIGRYKDSAWSEQEKTYAAMVELLDTDVGRILDKIREHQLSENTLVFFCSDNGAADRYDSTFQSCGPFKGLKRDVYEGGIRAPMIAWMPGTVEAGTTSSQVWYMPDILPTMASLLRQDIDRPLDGENLLPVLTLGQTIPLHHRTLYWEFHKSDGTFKQAARWRGWKAVKNSGTMDSPIEIYNLRKDPGEENNLAEKNGYMLNRFKNYFDTCRTPNPMWPVKGEKTAE